MAHMVIYHVSGMREMRILKREKNSNESSPREPRLDAVAMRQAYATMWSKIVTFGASSRSYAAGEWMFEHREAVPTPLGGGTIAHSPYTNQGEILERKRDSVMYRTRHEPTLASMGMPKAILYYTCII